MVLACQDTLAGHNGPNLSLALMEHEEYILCRLLFVRIYLFLCKSHLICRFMAEPDYCRKRNKSQHRVGLSFWHQQVLQNFSTSNAFRDKLWSLVDFVYVLLLNKVHYFVKHYKTVFMNISKLFYVNVNFEFLHVVTPVG